MAVGVNGKEPGNVPPESRQDWIGPVLRANIGPDSVEFRPEVTPSLESGGRVERARRRWVVRRRVRSEWGKQRGHDPRVVSQHGGEKANHK